MENQAQQTSREADVIRYELNLHYAMIKNIAKRYVNGVQCLSTRDMTALSSSLAKIRSLTSKLQVKSEMAEALDRLQRDVYVLNSEQQFVKHATSALDEIRKKQKKTSRKVKQHKTFCKKLDKYIDESDQEVVASYVRELRANPELEGYSDMPSTNENPHEILQQFDACEKDMHKFLTAVHGNDGLILPDVPASDLQKKLKVTD